MRMRMDRQVGQDASKVECVRSIACGTSAPKLRLSSRVCTCKSVISRQSRAVAQSVSISSPLVERQRQTKPHLEAAEERNFPRLQLSAIKSAQADPSTQTLNLLVGTTANCEHPSTERLVCALSPLLASVEAGGRIEQLASQLGATQWRCGALSLCYEWSGAANGKQVAV